jgi:hypothetical protein
VANLTGQSNTVATVKGEPTARGKILRLAQNLLAMCLYISLCASALQAQNAPSQEPTRNAASDVTIIIQQRQVRFIARAGAPEMHLQVSDQSGEVIYDSGPVAAPEINWSLQNGNGELLKSGLYAYALSIKESGKEVDQAPGAGARVRRGHFIVDRAKDQDGKTDRLWVTSQNEGGVGAELTVASNEAATVAGAVISERTIEQHGAAAKRAAADRKIEAEIQKEAGQAAAITAGTVGRIAKFTTADEVGDSIISEVNGNIGIGVIAPKHRLAITGGPSWTSNRWNGAIELQNGAAIAWPVNGLGQRAGIGHSDGGTFFFRTNSDLGTTGSPALYDMMINDAGNVGIGTTTLLDGYKLHVAGNSLFSIANGGDIAFGAPNAETGMTITRAGGRADLRFEGSTLKLVAGLVGGPPSPGAGVAITTAGNVGIGTATPATKLHVQSSGFAELAIRSTNERAILALTNTLSAGPYTWTLESGVGGSFPSLFGIYNRNVGKSGLEIDGNLLVYVKALQITGGADFAENFDVRASDHRTGQYTIKIQPGMVVAIDPLNPGKLHLSRRAYDRRVAGIISGAGDVKPGMMMRQEGTLADGQHPVALSGRVYVWVDATRGSIRPGDLLTTSATAGHAMKVSNSAKAQGAIIGKAMTGLKAGKGLVLVLVTLQ